MEGRNEGGGYGCIGRVMTEEQMDLLRKQIAAFLVITEQLAEMYTTFKLSQNLYGKMMENPYGQVVSGHQIIQIPTRKRWNPNPDQLLILEGVYQQGQCTPSKQRIDEITAQLIQLGQVTETNVSNWFQNRRARSKKQKMDPTTITGGNEDVSTTRNKRKEPENTENSEVFEDSEIGRLIGSYNLPDQLQFL